MTVRHLGSGATVNNILDKLDSVYSPVVTFDCLCKVSTDSSSNAVSMLLPTWLSSGGTSVATRTRIQTILVSVKHRVIWRTGCSMVFRNTCVTACDIYMTIKLWPTINWWLWPIKLRMNMRQISITAHSVTLWSIRCHSQQWQWWLCGRYKSTESTMGRDVRVAPITDCLCQSH